MISLAQQDRVMRLETPLGKDALVITGFTGTEAISSLFRFEIEMMSATNDIKFEDIIGKQVSVGMILHDSSLRYFNGIISSFRQSQGAMDLGMIGIHQPAKYNAIMVPSLWLLSRTTDSRIFQNMTATEIIEKILKEKKISNFRMDAKSAIKREYCVQYNETDFNFISRLMESEGIFYFFEHEKDKHTLVIADNSSAHKPCPHQETARVQISTTMGTPEGFISGMMHTMDIRPNKYSLKDYNFKMPATDLGLELQTKMNVGPPEPEREIYEYPGDYENRKDGDDLSRIRMQQEESRITIVSGTGYCRAFCPGYRFKLESHYRQEMNDKEYVITSVTHRAAEIVMNENSGDKSLSSSYENIFTCIPHSVPYRPERKSMRPRIRGTQTAIVTGPKGEEIHTDEHGRVKVQFHWDREGKKDENSSCWIRVGQTWAGQGWGAVWIPRIGHEVIVDFLEGDPDRPIITGSVYHGNNTPPYKLPDNKTQSTIKSNSTLGGGGSNEIRFEDKKGSEEMFIHAQKDQNSTVENNRTATIKVNDSTSVGGDRSVSVTGNCSLTVDKDDTNIIKGAQKNTIQSGQTINVSKGMSLTVTGGAQISIGGGQTVSVSDGGSSTEIKGGASMKVTGDDGTEVSGSKSIKVDGDYMDKTTSNRAVEADGGLVIKSNGQGVSIEATSGIVNIVASSAFQVMCGPAMFSMDNSGNITLVGTNVIVTGSGNLELTGSNTTLRALGVLTTQAPTIAQN